MNQRIAPILLTQAAAADQFGVNVSVLRKGLLDLQLDVPTGKKLPLKTWLAALTGDGKTQRARRDRAHADLMELSKLRLSGQVADIETVKAYYGGALAALKTQLLEAATSLSYRCNPSDPELAREVLHEFHTRVLTSLCSQMESFIPPDARESTEPAATPRPTPRTRGVVARSSVPAAD